MGTNGHTKATRDTMATSTRPRFEHQLGQVEAQVLAMGDVARRMLVDAGIALQTMDEDRCRAVIIADDDVDARYVEIERAIVELIALQQPVASDLRRLIALLQTSLHLERVADSAVDIARLVLRAEGPKPGLVADLGAMEVKVRRMLDIALLALRQRRSDLCLTVVGMGEQLGEADTSILTALAVEGSEGGGGPTLPWLLWVDRAARVLDRAGDHVIDIAEAVWFETTGELRELDRDDITRAAPTGP